MSVGWGGKGRRARGAGERWGGGEGRGEPGGGGGRIRREGRWPRLPGCVAN